MRERHLHSHSENCAIKILSPMTHTEPISVILWQGNNILAPINTTEVLCAAGAEGRALPTLGRLSQHHPEGEGQESMAGQCQPQHSGCLEITVVNGHRARAGQDPGGQGAEPREHRGKEMVESTGTLRMLPGKLGASLWL